MCTLQYNENHGNSNDHRNAINLFWNFFFFFLTGHISNYIVQRCGSCWVKGQTKGYRNFFSVPERSECSMFKYYFRTIKFLNICHKCQCGPQWNGGTGGAVWSCWQALQWSECSAVHIISVIYFSFMVLVSYLLLHSRKGLSTVVQGIFWKFPYIFNSHFLCIFRYYKCSISEHSLHASQYTLPICLQGFQNKGFWLYARQVMHCCHLIVWTL